MYIKKAVPGGGGGWSNNTRNAGTAVCERYGKRFGLISKGSYLLKGLDFYVLYRVHSQYG